MKMSDYPIWSMRIRESILETLHINRAVQQNLLQYLLQTMQVHNQISPIQSLVPIRDVQNQYALQKKHWHVIASAQFMVPQLTFSLKITEVLLMFDMKLFLSIQIAVVPMMAPSQLMLDHKQLVEIQGYIPIEGMQQKMAIGNGIWELPVCPRCFLGYSCHSHKNN